jgi:hypothetical protein
MVSLKEQRTCVKFCTELDKTAVKTHIMCQANRTEDLSKTMTHKWNFQSRTEDDDDDDDERLGKP